MEIKARQFNPLTVKTDCLVMILPHSLSKALKDKKQLPSQLVALDTATGGWISDAVREGELNKFLHVITSHGPQGIGAKRLILVSTGSHDLKPAQFSKIATKIGTTLKGLPVKSAAISFNDIVVHDRDNDWAAQELASCIHQSLYVFDQFKSKKHAPIDLKKVELQATSATASRALNKDLAIGTAFATGINLARELGDTPANACTPEHLAKTAQALTRNNPKLTVKVLSEAQMAKLKMGSLLSVTAGTETPAKLIVLEYKGGKANAKPVALVGKGVTFDSGGISLKPGAGMDEMKYDMCGAASVLGTFAAITAMNAPVNLVGVIPAVENMPSGKATKPGDIVTSMSGQTIEILNTDAEGRLILCDALTYTERFKPAAVIDIATLTGACVVALGNHATGLFSNDDDLASKLTELGQETGDRVWHMPIWEEYDQQLKSNFADMANVGGRNAGAITAACFLARFTKKMTWAHLDIAGTAWNSGANKGATGRPVKLLTSFVLDSFK